MKKRNKKAVIMAMIGGINGILFSIIFNNSSNMIVIIPVAGVIGGLLGTVIDRNKNKNMP